MRRLIRKTLVVFGTSIIIVVLLFYVVYRPWQLNWGATEQEVHRVMRGDDIVRDPTFNATRAVTIKGRPEEIWPWIVQIGYRRAGFYSHDWLDNDGIPSAERILPAYQSLTLGDKIPLSKSADAEIQLLELDKFMLLVIEGGSDTHETWTWAWALDPKDEDHTRLVTRLRVRMRNPLSSLMLDAFEIVMMRKCLLGIKRRVEGQLGAKG